MPVRPIRWLGGAVARAIRNRRRSRKGGVAAAVAWTAISLDDAKASARVRQLGSHRNQCRNSGPIACGADGWKSRTLQERQKGSVKLFARLRHSYAPSVTNRAGRPTPWRLVLNSGSTLRAAGIGSGGAGGDSVGDRRIERFRIKAIVTPPNKRAARLGFSRSISRLCCSRSSSSHWKRPRPPRICTPTAR
jgi:hypothetical protein